MCTLICKLWFNFGLLYFYDAGAEGGGIDFEVIRVGEDAKQQCTLKNKGKYEVEFS